MHVVGALGLGGATPAAVTAPTPTTESVAAGGAPAGKTFSAFTDADGRIASYSAAIVNAVGSTAIAGGSGLGAYTVSGYADGDAYSIVLTALDSGGNPLASAVHVVDIATAATNVTAPAATSESVASGGTPANVTFSAFTDPDSRIASYSKTEINAVGSATWTGTGLGAYSVSGSADGDSGAILLTALDSGGDPLATAVHVWDVAAAAGAIAWTADSVEDWTTDVAVGSLSGAGTATIYAGDGTTPRVTITNTSSAATGTWGASWGTNGIVLDGPASGGALFAWPLTVPGGVDQNKDYICLNVQGKLVAAPNNGASITLGIGTTVSVASGRWAGVKLTIGSTTYTQRTRSYNGGTVEGPVQNTVDIATDVYLTMQLRFANGRAPTIAWRVDTSAPALPTSMVAVDGVTWWGEDPGAWATSGVATLVGAFPGTIYLSSSISVGTNTEFAIEKTQFLTLDIP